MRNPPQNYKTLLLLRKLPVKRHPLRPSGNTIDSYPKIGRKQHTRRCSKAVGLVVGFEFEAARKAKGKHEIQMKCKYASVNETFSFPQNGNFVFLTSQLAAHIATDSFGPREPY